MRTHLLVLLVGVAAFGIGLGFASNFDTGQAEAHGSNQVAAGVSLTVVSPGQLVCVARWDSIATFRVDENGGLKKVDIDVFVPSNRLDTMKADEAIYGPDD